jgi:hypothetical protein
MGGHPLSAGTTFVPLRYPDFLCIGAQKAGTTWLHQALSTHPDLWLPPLKEVHYFDVVHLNYRRDPETGLTGVDRTRIEKSRHAIERLNRHRKENPARRRAIEVLRLIGQREHTDEWYGKIFAAAPPGAKCGEITPEYALLPRAGIEHILRLSPGAKFIFVLRDPIERGWSDLRMVRSRPNAKGVPELDRIKTRDFFARSDYMTTIERYRTLVPPENFLTVYFDDIAAKPRPLLQSVCEFLGVPFDRGAFEGLEQPVHQGEPIELPSDIHDALKAALKPAYERLRALHNPVIEGWYRHHYE